MIIGQLIPTKARSTQGACAEHDGCVADLLWLAHGCVHTGSVAAAGCYSQPFIFLFGICLWWSVKMTTTWFSFTLVERGREGKKEHQRNTALMTWWLFMSVADCEDELQWNAGMMSLWLGYSQVIFRSIFAGNWGKKNQRDLWWGAAGAARELRCWHGQFGCSDLLTPSVWTRR